MIVKRLLNVFSLLFFLAIDVTAVAQSYQTQFLEVDGLSQDAVTSIIQDHNGFMWFGTWGGLNRFDGHEFVIYQNETKDSLSLIDNEVLCMLEDSHNFIWVGTANGLCYYDYTTDGFYEMPFDGLGNSENGDEVSTIYEDSRQNIWVATGNKEVIVYEFDENVPPSEYKVQSYTLPDAVGDGENLVPFQIVEDRSNTFWLVGREAVYNANYEANSNTISIRNYFHPNTNKISGIDNFVFKDKSDVLWIRTPHDYLVSELGDSLVLPEDTAKYPHIWSHTGLSIRVGLEDMHGNFWFGGMGTYPFVIDPENGDVTLVKGRTKRADYDEKNVRTHLTHVPMALAQDHSGNIWLGHAGEGVSIYNPRRQVFDSKNGAEKILTHSIRTIHKSRDGILWFTAADGHLYHYDKKAGKAVKCTAPYLNGASSQLNIPVRGVVEEADGSFWGAHVRGMVKIERNGTEITDWKYWEFDLDQYETVKNRIYSIHDGGDYLWLLSRYKLFSVNKQTLEVEAHRFQTHKDEGAVKSVLFFRPDIYMQSDSIFWISTTTGLKRYDVKQNSFDNHTLRLNQLPEGIRIRKITPDPLIPEKQMWLATAFHGLVRFEFETGKFEIFDKEDGLVDNSLYAALPDPNGFLWLSSNNGVMRFNTTDYSVVSYDVSDGLQDNEFNIYGEHASFDGEFFLGGIKGLNRFYPDAITQSDFAPTTIFTSLRINNKEVDFKNGNGRLLQQISATTTLDVYPEDQVITLGFSSTDYVKPNKVKYQYKLENFDDAWQNIGTARSVTFTNLDPGKYVLKVRSTNSDGIWSDKVTSLTLTVIPPWYARWWAYCAYILLAGSIIYTVYRIQLRRRLDQQEAIRLQELDIIKTRFFANISHEFRTPITLIQGVSEILKKSFDTNDTAKFERDLEVIERNSAQLLSLVNQLLDLSKLESGALNLNRTAIDLKKIVDHFVANYNSSLEMRGITLEFKCEAENPIVDADERALGHIIQNLLGNAVKFTNAGSIKVLIEEREKSYLAVQIQDTGIGISKEELPHIYDRFYQVDSSFSKQYAGTGIGLALTKELVHLLDADIQVESELGKGTTFTLIFERSDSPEGAASVSTEVAPPVPVTAKITQNSEVENSDKPTILVVEDNTDMQYFITEVLQADYQIVTADNGEEGLKKALELVPDFIISDWMMPVMTGPEMLNELKRNKVTSHVPCMLLTARADQKSKLTGYEFGAEAYLAKPFEPAELKVRIQSLIRSRNEIREYVASKAPEAEPIEKFNVETEFLNKVIADVESKLGDSELDGDWLAEQHFLSRSQFARKLKAITGLSITQFVRQRRMEAAKKLLEEGKLNVSEIAFEIGFSDPAYFSRIFSNEVGMPPSEYADSKK